MMRVGKICNAGFCLIIFELPGIPSSVPGRRHTGQDITRTGQNLSPLQGYRLSGCTAGNGFPVQSRACCRLWDSFDSPYLRTQSYLLNRMLFRTRERVTGLHKYPQCEAGNIRCAGLFMPEPGDDYPRYPEILPCLFSFFLPSGNHLPIS
jgi:hypothetical protein